MGDSSSDDEDWLPWNDRECPRFEYYEDESHSDDDWDGAWGKDCQYGRDSDRRSCDMMDDSETDVEYCSKQFPRPSYAKIQPDLDESARAATVDWLVSVQTKYHLKTETLFLAVSILDRFLAAKRVQRGDLQLVACTAVFIAAKFEEVQPPEIRDFVFITDQSCRKDAILTMEVAMLSALEFCLCRPTAAHYLERYQRECHRSEEHGALLQYFLELALLDFRMTRFSPSTLGDAASLLSSRLLKIDQVGEYEHAGQVVQSCMREMLATIQEIDQSPLQAVRQKFSRPEYHGVAAMPFSTHDLVL